MRSRPGSGVATWLTATGLKLGDLFLASQEGALVIWCRDINVMSRPDSGCPVEIGVATPIFEVATKAVLVGQKGGRDMGLTSRPGLVVQEVVTWKRCHDLAWGWAREGGRNLCPRPGRYARDLPMLTARPALAVRVTCARPVGWALHAQRARYLVSGCAHCAHNPVL